MKFKRHFQHVIKCNGSVVWSIHWDLLEWSRILLILCVLCDYFKMTNRCIVGGCYRTSRPRDRSNRTASFHQFFQGQWLLTPSFTIFLCMVFTHLRRNIFFFDLFSLIALICIFVFTEIFQAKFDVMNCFYLNMLEKNNNSVAIVWFAKLYELNTLCWKWIRK